MTLKELAIGKKMCIRDRLPTLNACFTSPSISADKITLQSGFTNPKIATLETSFHASSIDQSVYATAETSAR